MNRITLDDPQSVQRAVQVLRTGGVIVYPTDTAYGLGVDATNPDAVEKIFAIKECDASKPIPVIVGSIEQAREYVAFNAEGEKLAHAFWPGALTIVLPTANSRLAHILRGETESGVRVPASEWCRRVAQELGCPITSTSANASGTLPEYSIEGVAQSLAQHADTIDLWVDGGTLFKGPVSTIVRMVDVPFEIQREGAISGGEIREVLETSQ